MGRPEIPQGYEMHTFQGDPVVRRSTVTSLMSQLETIACSDSSEVAFIYNDLIGKQEYIILVCLFAYGTILDIKSVQNVL